MDKQFERKRRWRMDGVGAVALGLTGVTCLLLAACKHRGYPDFPDVSPKAFPLHQMEIQEKKNISEERHVVIEGADIQLPLNSGKLDPQEKRTYSFYIWAYHPTFSRETSLEELWKSGIFSVDVVGAKASIHVPREVPASLSGATINLSPGTLTSRSVLEVELTSQGLEHGFSIVAWFPKEYMGFKGSSGLSESGQQSEDKFKFDLANITNSLSAFSTRGARNPWGERHNVRVFNGDIRTHVDIVDERQVAASFGKRFAKFYHVGRVFFRNRHPDKRLLVYTTSLRASAILYRPPIDSKRRQELLGSNAVTVLRTNASERFRQARFLLREEQFEKLWQAGMRAIDEKKIRLDDPVDKKQPVAKAIAIGVISSTETNAIVKIAAGELVCMDYWRRMANSIQGWREEVRINRKKASEQAAVMSQIFEGSKKDLKESSPLSDQASNALHDVSTNFAALGVSQDHASVTANALSLELALKDPRTPDRNKAVGLKKAGEILGFLTRAADCQLLEQALENRSPTILAASGVTPVHFEQLKLDYNSAVRSARDVAEARYRESGPFDQTLDIMVNADSRPLAFSQDADLQRKLSEVGYLWRETCRPMTFQAVLNSLIFNHEKAPGSRTYAILESLAKVAGGLVGLGTVANEFSSRSYLASVNLYSTIVLPELQKQLMDDLKKLIRNLGEMGMDNIMSIPPNDVVDRYVFFPKGPIYNHVDEFNVSDPAYIVRIDSDDAGVEATLIDQDVVVHGGSADAGRLVERALNEGRAEQNAEMMKQIELKERLRRLELATMITQVETALLGTRCPTNSEPKPNDRIIKEGQVRKLVADHEVRFGKDSSGLIASLMAKNCIDYYDSAPTVTTSAIQKVEVLAGGETMPLLLPVSDAQTPASRLQITPTAESPDRINVGKIKITRPGLTSTGTNSEDGPITVVIPTEPNLPVIQSVETSISFAVKDEGGNSVTARIPITLQPADLQLQSETEGVKPESSGSGFKLEGNNLNQILTFNYKLFIYQANSENWKVSVTNTANDNIDVSLEELPLTIEAGGKGVLSGRIRVDPSVCCPGTNSVLSQSRIVVRWNTNAIVEKTLKLRLQPK